VDLPVSWAQQPCPTPSRFLEENPMLRKFALTACAGAFGASPIGAQAFEMIWPENCNHTVQMLNGSGLKLGSLWISIDGDNLNNPPEIQRIVLNDGSGLQWRVDDNEDGDDNDGLQELDETDSTPGGNATGWHRVQAGSSADVILPGRSYSLLLCARNGNSLRGRTIHFFGVQPGTGGDGDGGIATASDPETIDALDDEVEVTLVEGQVPPISPLTFTFKLTNGYAFPLDKLRVFARQSDVMIQNVTSSIGGTYMGDVYVFPTPIIPGGSVDMTFTLNHLSMLPPRGPSPPVTEIVFQRIIVSVPSLPAWGKLAFGAGLVAVAYCVLAQRRGPVAAIQR
jgi:hypothetical protein